MIKELKSVDQGIIDFLLVDLDIALTFMDVARTTEFRDTAERNHGNAKAAYNTVLAKLPEVRPTRAQRVQLEQKLAVLRGRLEAVGQL